MKQTSGPRSKTPQLLPEPSQRRLNMYALAASAAGVSVLALAHATEAKIIYTKTDVVIGAKDIYNLDLNHDGTTDFKLANYTFFTDTTVASLLALGQSNNKVVGKQLQTGLPQYAYALKAGAIVGPKQPLSGVLMAGSDGFNHWGKWDNVTNRYLGLKFFIKGKVHYGWARLNVSIGQNTITGTLTGYAYETTVNKTIVAGKTKGADVIAFPPTTLGRLAAGSARLGAGRSTALEPDIN
jgi:hypothetical protein